MLRTNALTFQYNNGPSIDFPDILCQKGESWLVLGQSGSGKTTLLHLLGGLLPPSSGTIEVGGTDIANLSPSQLDQFRGKHIGIIFQQAHFIRALSVGENLKIAQQLAGLPVDMAKVTTFLERLNIGDKIDKKTDELSVGEKQRVAIARALINQPDIILADEPTSALDDKNCDEVVQLLEEQAAAVDATLLVVTHDGRLKDKFSHQILMG
ncbi:MAG: ATP-binding cassette domain-containing protein [Saprospiraceae bacterium]|nr:ATP-binding cassette domain-containing protein [Saprospiraceae bacterium]